MTSSLPLATVIVLCYNQEQFVITCLESILAQTYSNIQMIIIDDHSRDNSVEVIHHWITKNEIQCTFIIHTENQGICKTINHALTYATGKYITIIASDDLWLPEFIEKYVQIHENWGVELGFVYGQTYVMDENGTDLNKVMRYLEKPYEGYVYEKLLERNFIAANSVVMKKECLDKVGPYDENLSYEDYDMWLRLTREYPVAFCPQILSKYRLVNTSMTKTKHKEKRISRALIYLKQQNLDQSSKEVIENKLINDSELLYEMDHPSRNKYLWLGFKKLKQIKYLFLFIISSLGIPYNFFLSTILVFMPAIQKIRGDR